MTITKPIPLAKFRTAQRQTVAKLQGMKSIMRVESPRKYEWFLVLPSVGKNDAVCVSIQKCPKWEHAANVEKRLLAEYADRIVEA